MVEWGWQGKCFLAVLGDIDRALSVNEDEGLSLIGSKMWSELSSDGVSKIETKGEKFDPSKMNAITAIPPSEDYPANSVIEELEAGYMYTKTEFSFLQMLLLHQINEPQNNFCCTDFDLFELRLLGRDLLPCFFRTSALIVLASLPALAA